MSEKEGIKAVLGIDIGKERFSVALLRGGKYKHRGFANNAEGFKALSRWLQRQGVEDVGGAHACMESTGVYG